MILLDENLPESQRQLLRGWRILVRQVGVDAGRKGMEDGEIIPLLLRLRRPTFFTLDSDFYERDLCHRRYCLVFLDIGQYEAATFVRRLLSHTEFDTETERMGAVVVVSHVGISAWRIHGEREIRYRWGD